MNLDTEGLEYFVSAKPPFLVVSFVGAMTKASMPILEKCLTELDTKKELMLFVLNLHDVSRIETVALPPLTKMQKSVRDRNGLVRVCFLKPDLRHYLIEKAAIREGEIEANLIEALTNLKEQFAQLKSKE